MAANNRTNVRSARALTRLGDPGDDSGCDKGPPIGVERRNDQAERRGAHGDDADGGVDGCRRTNMDGGAKGATEVREVGDLASR